MGADGQGERSGEGAVPLPRKKEFLPETRGFWCTFTFMQKLVRSMGRRPPPLKSATDDRCRSPLLKNHEHNSQRKKAMHSHLTAVIVMHT